MTAIQQPASPTAYRGNPWLPAGVVMAATIMVSLDSTIVNVALHGIGVSLKAGGGIEWVVTSYLLAVCASQPATGWLADRFGRKEVLLGSLVAFTIASVACATAGSLPVLVLFRVLQGLGGGAILPVSMAMLLELFPGEQRGRAMAWWAISAMAAPAIGPTVGGWLVTAVSWHWLFLINLPIGVLTLVAGARLLPHIGHREHRPFDLLGLVFGGVGLSLTVLGVGQGNSWGWRSASTVGCLVVGVVALAAFGWHELHRADPLIDLHMFANSPYRLSTGVMMLLTAANYARLVFIPLQLESLRGYTALRVGVLFAAPAVSSAVGMAIGGRLVDRIGPRRPVVIGCSGMVVAMVLLARLSLSTPVWAIVALMSLQGIAWGVTTSPGLVAGMAELPARLTAQASAARALSGQVAGAMSVAVLGAVVSTRMGSDPSPTHAQAAFNASFIVGAVAVLGGLVLGARLPRRVEHANVDRPLEVEL